MAGARDVGSCPTLVALARARAEARRSASPHGDPRILASLPRPFFVPGQFPPAVLNTRPRPLAGDPAGPAPPNRLDCVPVLETPTPPGPQPDPLEVELAIPHVPLLAPRDVSFRLVRSAPIVT